MDVLSAGGKGSESDPDSSTRIQTPKVGSFSNGVLKRTFNGGVVVGGGGGGGGGGNGNGGVVYKECLKNHAASIGAHAVDGCGEFMPSPAANSADPTSLKCAACGCHRNFHRQETDQDTLPASNTATPALEYQPHHRHHPPPPHRPPPQGGGGGGGGSTPSSPSPPPISSSYYPSAPHLLLTLSGGSNPVVVGNRTTAPVAVNGSGRKRFRTRFSQNQKDKMLEFAEKLGWKMQKKDEDLIANFCNEIAVEKGVFKVWMHNNKNIFGKKEHSNSIFPATTTTTTFGINPNSTTTSAAAAQTGTNNVTFVHHHLLQNHGGHQNEINVNNNNNHNNHFHGDSFDGPVARPNCSSSTS